MSVAGCLVVCGLALGQSRKPADDVPNPKKSEVFEEQEWYVATASGGTTARSEELYAGPSKAAAEEACRKWEAANKATKPNWITNVSDPIKVKVPVARPAAQRDRPKIEFQDPKFVDPGSTKNAAKRVPELKGKKAQGQIGNLKVMFEFADKDKLEITGDATGSGKWKVEGSALFMETAVATYRGTVTEAGGAGLRFWKDGSQPLTQWNFVFGSVASAEKGANSLVGTKWREPPQFDRGGSLLEFVSETKVKRTGISPSGVRLPDVEKTTEYTWKQEADGTFVIGENGFRGKYEKGQKELKVSYGPKGSERTITYYLVK
jgi:hypothetical protein